MLKILSLPLSNTVVERVFSVMNTVKTKSRNRINVHMLDALLRVKCKFMSPEKFCTTFSPTKLMYDKFKSDIRYKIKQDLVDREISEDDDLIWDDDLIDLVNIISLPGFYD